MSVSYYVETGPMENCGLDSGVRFATRDEAERAMAVLEDYRGRQGTYPVVMESAEIPTADYAAWCTQDWPS